MESAEKKGRYGRQAEGQSGISLMYMLGWTGSSMGRWMCKQAGGRQKDADGEGNP